VPIVMGPHSSDEAFALVFLAAGFLGGQEAASVGSEALNLYLLASGAIATVFELIQS
jgi:hypothetical protein